MFLNFFPSKLDKKNALFPNLILTTGEMYTDTLNKYGHYPNEIKTFAALRFDYCVKNGSYLVEKPDLNIKNKILYAFPVHIREYVHIINDLVDIFANINIEVHLKFHPIFLKKIKIKLPVNFKILDSTEKLKLRETYDVVLFNDNSFGIESLIMGVKSFEYHVNSIYDQTRMFEFKIYKNKLKKEDLKIMRDSLLDGTYDKKFSVVAATSYINRHYKAYDSTSLIFNGL